jgi:hypothetical protein
MAEVQKTDRILTRKDFQLLAQLRADETATLAKGGKRVTLVQINI